MPAFDSKIHTDSSAILQGVLGSSSNQAVLQRSSINSDDVVAWLITQPNANGTLYLERVVRSYMWTLHNAPVKLELPASVKRNVFECGSVDELESLIETFKTAPNYADINQSMGRGQLSAGLAVFRRYLEHLENNINVSNKINKTVSVNSPDTAEMPNGDQYVDFNMPELCAQTKPLSCTINGQNIVPLKQNWSQLLVAITEYYIEGGSPSLDSLNTRALYGSKAFFLSKKAVFGTCAQLSNGKKVYINYNPQTIVTIIRNLCRHSGTDLRNVIITFEPKNNERRMATIQRQVVESRHTRPVISEMQDGEACSAIETILSERFSNGFAYTSPIQVGRIKKLVNEMIGRELTESDESLIAYIKRCGTEFDGKVYVVGKATKEKIKQSAEDYFAEGACAIFYEGFYATNERWLSTSSVVSEEMLTGIFRSLFPRKTFTKVYFGDTREPIPYVIKKELNRIWGDDVLHTCDKLAERLQYIPLERIKNALIQNKEFLWNAVGEFTHINKVHITDEEKAAIRQFAESDVTAHGYASTAYAPHGDIADRNYELSETGIQNAIYYICLSGNYDHHGKFIVRKGDKLIAKDIIDDYCRSHDRCTLGELLDLEREITGGNTRWLSMQAAYETMIRIDDKTFVADKYIEFDANAADGAIEQFIGGGEYIPLQAVTTFALFPHCGQAWNLFLLESYCRRFSQGFRFETRAVNSRNAGAIIRKNSRLTYDDIMADSVARSNTPLVSGDVLNYLLDNGLISRRKHKDIESLVKNIRTIREGRN